MYNQVIIDKLKDINNLKALKKPTVTYMSKKNEFDDVVKFFAHINVDNVIEDLTFKATGCSAFVAMCSFFCDMAKSKTIDEALKISSADLEQITTLNSTKVHVYDIIIKNFAELIKKFKKGVEKGTIIPCEKSTREVAVKASKKSDKSVKDIPLEDLDIAVADNLTDKILKKNEDSKKDTRKLLQKEKLIESKVEDKEKEEKMGNTNKKETEKVSKKATKETTKEPKVTKKVVSEKKVVEKTPKAKVISTKKTESVEYREIPVIHVENNIDANQASHLKELKTRLASKELNDRVKNNTESLNSILNRIHIESTKPKTEESKQHASIQDIKNSLNAIKLSKENNSSVPEENVDKKSDDKKVEKEEKQKKSLFSWMKKK